MAYILLTPYLVHVLVVCDCVGVDVAVVVATPRVRVQNAIRANRRRPQPFQDWARIHRLPVSRDVEDRDFRSLRHTPALRESRCNILSEARVSKVVAIELRAQRVSCQKVICQERSLLCRAQTLSNAPKSFVGGAGYRRRSAVHHGARRSSGRVCSVSVLQV